MKILEKQSYEDYSVQGGVLMKTVNGKTVVVVPEKMQMDIMRKVHDNGHFGVVKMTEVIEQDYFIPKLREKLERLMENCINCILAERKKGKREGYLRPIPKENAPLLTYHLDHLGPMHMTCKMYKYLFVVVDAFTKYSWIYPTKTTNAQEVLNCLERQQKTFGNPRRIIADKGGAFTSNLVSEYCENEGIKLITITTAGQWTSRTCKSSADTVVNQIIWKQSRKMVSTCGSSAEMFEQYLSSERVYYAV